MDKVIVTGAIDRHNYGDLLFPILIKEYIEKYKQQDGKIIPIEFYGTVKSDLSKFGAIKTEESNKLFDSKVTENTIVIVIGGAVLFASWINIMSYLKSDLFFTLIKYGNKIIPSDFMESILKKAFNFKLIKPFIIDKNLFSKKKPKVTYNAAGSSQVQFLSEKSKKYISKTLNNSDYISVRDQESFVNLNSIGVTKDVMVSPDSALIMSDFFPIEVLNKKVEQSTLNILDKLNRNYFCLQVGLKFADDNYSVIANSLDEISTKHNISILLLPIGNAPGHNNDVALNNILSLMKTKNVEILKSSNVYDIMLGIAASKFFAGTSLHGNITATSFNVQSIVLTNKVLKLNNYVKTWLEEDEINIVEFEDLSTTFSSLNKKPFNGYKNLEPLKKKVYDNYDKLFSVLKN